MLGDVLSPVLQNIYRLRLPKHGCWKLTELCFDLAKMDDICGFAGGLELLEFLRGHIFVDKTREVVGSLRFPLGRLDIALDELGGPGFSLQPRPTFPGIVISHYSAIAQDLLNCINVF